MPLRIIATRFPVRPDDLDEVAGTLNSVYTALASNLDGWDSTEVLIDDERGEAWLLARWSDERAARSFEESAGYRALLDRVAPHLTGAPETKRMRGRPARRNDADREVDIAISGSLG